MKPDPESTLYKIITWLYISCTVGLTAWVWVIAFKSLSIRGSNLMLSTVGFDGILLSYHLVLGLTAAAGWAMQEFRAKYNYTGLFPISLLFGCVLLALLAIRLRISY